MPTNYLIDSHCHIHDTNDFSSTPEEIIARANQNNVRQIIVIGTSHEDSLAARNFANSHENIFWSYGIHPSETENGANRPAKLANFGLSGCGGGSAEISKAATFSSEHEEGGSRGRVPKIFRSETRIDFGKDNARQDPRSEKLVAIGEVGLDYHYKPYDREAQIKLFEEMIALSKKHNLPMIFHIREAFDDFFPIIENQHVTRAIVHSFSDNKDNLAKSLDHGFYIGVNGLATFADIPLPPLERMLLETDAPYLTPSPFRGKINESAYIKTIAEYLASKLNIPLEKITEETTKNVQTLFQLPQPILRAS
ncbi:TatD family hydrolase [Candidatus Saccharibacteria bacterium]|nr:TatD family hydrolase [Candidatus Saccharibacteria bacterium]